MSIPGGSDTLADRRDIPAAIDFMGPVTSRSDTAVLAINAIEATDEGLWVTVSAVTSGSTHQPTSRPTATGDMRLQVHAHRVGEGAEASEAVGYPRSGGGGITDGIGSGRIMFWTSLTKIPNDSIFTVRLTWPNINVGECLVRLSSEQLQDAVKRSLKVRF